MALDSISHKSYSWEKWFREQMKEQQPSKQGGKIKRVEKREKEKEEKSRKRR